MSFLALALAGTSGCGEDEESSAERAELPERPTVPTRTRAVVARPSLASVEALQDPENILEADPTPLHPSAAVSGGRLRRARPNTLPSRYNWVTENYVQVHEMVDYVGERIARRHRDQPSKWAPQLAEKVTVSDDGRTYTIHLRRGITWQRPLRVAEVPTWLRNDTSEHELTAHDFAFTFEMLSDERLTSAAPLRSWYADLERIEVLDDHTFEMVWRRPGLAAEMWTLWFSPIPEFIFAYDKNGQRLPDPALMLDNHFYRFPIGTGPYRVTAERREQLLQLERNPDYHGVQPPIDVVVFESMEPGSLGDALNAGWVDVARLTPELYLEYSSPVDRRHPGAQPIVIEEVPALTYTYIAWNARRGPTAHRLVRRALTYALDRRRALEEIYFGLGTIRTGPYSSRTPYADPDAEPIPFDPLQAAALLDRAGWRDVDSDGVREHVDDPSNELRLRIRPLGNPEGLALLDMYAEDLATIGVRLEPPTEDDLGRLGEVLAWDGIMGSWGHDWEDDPYQVFHSSQDPARTSGGSNYGGFDNAEADALIEKIRTESDHETRVRLHRQLHRLLQREQPYTPLFEHHLAIAHSLRVRGVRFGLTAPHDLSLGWWLDPDAPD